MTSPAGYQNDDWYLIANQDGLAIKLRGGVTLGEDAAGALCLDARDQASRWLALSLEAGHLLVSEQGNGVQLAREGSWSANAGGLVLARGTVLEFPNNDVYVSQSLHRGVVNMRVSVRCDADAEGLTPPASSPEVSPAPAPKPASAAPPRGAVAAPKVTAARNPEQRDDGVMAVPDIPEALQYVAADRVHRRSGIQWWMGAGLVVLVAAVGGLLYQRFVVTPPAAIPNEAARQPIAEAMEATVSSGTSAPATDPPEPGPDAIPQAIPQLVDADDTSGTTAPLSDDPIATDPPDIASLPARDEAPASDNTPSRTARIEPLSERAQPSDPALSAPPQPAVNPELELERLLREAQSLIDQGFLTWPEVNATTVIADALRVAPGEPRALALRESVAADLLLEAQVAYADGFQGSALDMLDQVLAFHPEFAPALAQRSQWRQADITSY